MLTKLLCILSLLVLGQLGEITNAAQTIKGRAWVKSMTMTSQIRALLARLLCYLCISSHFPLLYRWCFVLREHCRRAIVRQPEHLLEHLIHDPDIGDKIASLSLWRDYLAIPLIPHATPWVSFRLKNFCYSQLCQAGLFLLMILLFRSLDKHRVLEAFDSVLCCI